MLKGFEEEDRLRVESQTAVSRGVGWVIVCLTIFVCRVCEVFRALVDGSRVLARVGEGMRSDAAEEVGLRFIDMSAVR